MLKTILSVIAIAIVGLLVLIMMQPDEFRVARSATIPATASAIFPHVNDLKQWEAWSPWVKLDPNAVSTFEGPNEGKGAIMHWDGNNDVGKGTMTITESQPDEFIKFKLEFLKPMQGISTAEFKFEPASENQTNVTWTMYGKNGFMSKAIGLFMNCEEMVGEQFDKGLENLRAVVEQQSPVTEPLRQSQQPAPQ